MVEEVEELNSRGNLRVGEYTQGGAKIVRILIGMRSDFFTEPSQYPDSSPTDKCFQLQLETLEEPKEEFVNTFSLNLSPIAKLGKFKKRYGQDPKKGMLVDVIRNEQGRLEVFLG